MNIEQFDVWIANLNPRSGTESGKTRPVVVLQSNLLNRAEHPSTIICPLTTNVKQEAKLLRVHLDQGMANVEVCSDIMIDQIRSIDNKRLIKKVGRLPEDLVERLKENLLIVLDLGNRG
jgi:mRNA interferase MazF